MSQAHPPEVLAAFQSGETALVYARRKSDGSLFFLEDDTASRDGLRTWVASELECVLPNCPDRRLRLVNRHSLVRTARDGFSHHANAGCNPSPESLFHQQGKAAVVAWVRTHRPGLTVEVEVDLGTRRPDVLITSPDGRRLAIEVQYAALTVAEVEERTTSYASLGIAVQWLWGHAGKHFQIAADDPISVALDDAQRAAINAGTSILWLNPIANLLGTPVERSMLRVAGGVWRTPPTPEAYWVGIAVEPFDDAVTLHPERGFITRAQLQAERERGWYDDAKDRHAEALHTVEKREQESQQRLAEQAAKRKAAREQKAEAEAAQRQEAQQRAEAERQARQAEHAKWMNPERRARLDAVLASNKRNWADRVAANPDLDVDRPPPPAVAVPTLQPAPQPAKSPTPGASAAEPVRRACPVCGLPVDPVLRSGYHLGCEPPTARNVSHRPIPPEQPEEDGLF